MTFKILFAIAAVAFVCFQSSDLLAGQSVEAQSVTVVHKHHQRHQHKHKHNRRGHATSFASHHRSVTTTFAK